MLFERVRENNFVIHVDMAELTVALSKYVVHCPLEDSRCIGYAKWDSNECLLSIVNGK